MAKEAEAKLYAERQAAQAVTLKAEAVYFAKKKEAEALTESTYFRSLYSFFEAKAEP